ncbi:hypothetical protein [Phytohabitans rumicis]|uniref:Uncharacterized protein n=1 Tax=Phytohabitans rumicis TaxID=1076125 RepID=A0A6V8LQ50_9ACTN|nr:hypothetical protein [Phytohabitans rumicis]GFJ96247.1 hypothetical protein Prum_098890 [Phytohabitans rumicis]
MSATVTFRNAITDARQEVQVAPGQTVRQAVENSGFVAAGSAFSVRDKNGQVVDDQPATTHANTVLSVGLPGDRVVGGGLRPPD